MQPRKSQFACRVRIFAQMCLGLGFAFASTFIPSLWPTYYQKFIADQLKMTPDSKTFQMWSDNPLPIYIEFYFFNWTNRDSLEEDGEMHIPQFQELGPYRFGEKIERVNLTWNNNGTVTYKQARWWYFQPELSKGSLNDIITTLNVVALTAAHTVRDWNYILRASTSAALSATGQTIHIKRTVGELLFEGYSDKLIDIARTLPNFANVKIPLDKFAWFYKRNGTTFMDGVFNMNTGVDDIKKLGKLENWNYSNRTEFFSDTCGQVRGTMGQLFPPGQTKDKKVEMFSPDLCRTVGFEYEEETEVEGVSGYKYQGGLSMLDNGTVFPETECFCNGECVPAGVTNLTVCRFGAPAFASFPHFYLADSYFTDSVRGLRPDKKKHEFYLTLEPTTGIPLDVAARLQINILLQQYSGIGLYDKVPTVFFPMLWFKQRATITPELARPLRLLLLLRHLGALLALLTALIACLLVGYAGSLWTRLNSMQTKQFQKGEDDSHLYVASQEQNIDKGSSNQYIIMKQKK